MHTKFCDFVKNNSTNITLTSYAIFTTIISIFHPAKYSFVLLPVIIIESLHAYIKSKNMQLNLSKLYIDNFLYDYSESMVKQAFFITFFVYFGRNGISHFCLDLDKVAYYNYSPIIFVFIVLLNTAAFIQGYIIMQFIPNPNAVNRKWFKKIIICLCVIITFVPLGYMPKLSFSEKMYSSTFFLALAGYIDGGQCMDDTFWKMNCCKFLVIFYIVVISYVTLLDVELKSFATPFFVN